MKKAARDPVTLCGKGDFWCHSLVMKLILPAFFAWFSAAPAWARPPINRPPATSMPLDEIISKLGSLQSRLDSLSAVRTKLRQDSANDATDFATRAQSLSKKQAEADDAIAKKKAAASGVRSRYEKAQLDSAAIVAKSKEQMDRVRKEMARLDAAVISVSNELSALSGRRIETGLTSADERAVTQLQTQGMQIDSLIRARQADLMNLSARRSKLRQDSVDIETRRMNDGNRFHSQMYPFDSLAALCDAAMRMAEQKKAGDQAARDQKIAQMKANFSGMAQQKNDYDERSKRNNTDIATFSNERQKLAQSAGAAQQRYEQLRGPYEKAMNVAMTETQRITRDKPLLQSLRKKLRIDSTIAKTRDALDKAIQLSATNQRGGKKLVEQRESELDSLLAERDLIVRSTSGLRQIEAQIHGVTVSQKAAFTDSALANIDKRTAAAAAQLNKARRELEAFDQKNPPIRSPAAQRVAQLDTMIALKKKEAIRMTDWIDSINMALQDIQNSINSTSTPTQSGSQEYDRIMKEKKAEKAALADKRSRIQRDSAQNDAAGLDALNRNKNDAASLATQSVRVQSEIDHLNTERDKTKQSLASVLDKNRQTKNAAAAEKRKYDSLTASKQQEIANLSTQSEKVRQDSIAIIRQQEQQIKNLSPSPAVILSSLSDYTKEINALQTQSDSLKRLLTSGQGRTNEEARSTSQQIAAVNKLIENTRNDLATLSDQKKEAAAQLESDKRFYDSLITIAERERSNLTAERDKVRQDSISAENDISKALQKMSSLLKEHDNAITARQKEVADATAEYNRVRDDSVKLAQDISGASRTGAQSLRTIDSLMSIRSRELTDLQARHDKAILDSVKEGEHLATLLSAAHNEIVKRGIALEQRKNELSLSNAAKGGNKSMDPLERSYREALAAASTEIKTQNDVIKKKKSEITRLRTVRDALTGATEDSGSGDSRIDRDKLYYDSLLTIAAQELAAIISRRDIARQDSAAAEEGLKQASQNAAPGPERGLSANTMQKEVDDATAEYDRARSDSVKIASAIPVTMQPYSQTIRTMDALITVKGKELADLQDQREKIGGSGSTKRSAEQLAAAHKEIMKKNDALEQKKSEFAQAAAAKNTAQNESDPSMRNNKQILEAAKLSLNVENDLIAKKKDEISRLQNVRDAIAARLKQPLPAAQGGTTRAIASALSPQDSAQKVSEGIYVLIGEGRVDDAAAVFSRQLPLLKINMDQESFQALKMTITEMGGRIK